MKNSIWIIIFCVALLTNAAQIKVDNNIPLSTYNHAPIAQLYYHQKLRRLSKVTMNQAKEITRKECKEQIIKSQKITHRGQLLYYRITTQYCSIEINALDATVIKKEIYE